MKRDFWGIDGEIWGWNRYIITTIFNAQKRVLKNTPCKIGQMFKRKGGGSKAFWTMLKKTALFLMDGFPNLAGHRCSIVRSQPVWLLLCDGLLCEIYGWLCELCGIVPHSMAWLSGVEHATKAHRDALALCQVLSKTGWNCPNDRFYRTVRNIVGEGWGVK